MDENIRENPYEIRFSSSFLDMTLEAQKTTKIDELFSIKIKNFCAWIDSVKSEKTTYKYEKMLVYHVCAHRLIPMLGIYLKQIRHSKRLL